MGLRGSVSLCGADLQSELCRARSEWILLRHRDSHRCTQRHTQHTHTAAEVTVACRSLRAPSQLSGRRRSDGSLS